MIGDQESCPSRWWWPRYWWIYLILSLVGLPYGWLWYCYLTVDNSVEFDIGGVVSGATGHRIPGVIASVVDHNGGRLPLQRVVEGERRGPDTAATTDEGNFRVVVVQRYRHIRSHPPRWRLEFTVKKATKKVAIDLPTALTPMTTPVVARVWVHLEAAKPARGQGNRRDESVRPAIQSNSMGRPGDRPPDE